MDKPLKPQIQAKSSDSGEPAPPGTSDYFNSKKMSGQSSSPKFTMVSNVNSPSQQQTPKATEKIQRLRAFSIQKKIPITSVTIPKLAGSGNNTVLIGKLSSVKVTPKPTATDDDPKKPPRPPKPGTSKKPGCPDSYSDLQKKTLSEIEDMKRKMELVELGIPLGLICPTSNSEKAMPTKAMPPIKSFLDPSKVDELIREAKKAKAEGKEFKFDYQKLLPDYDNPFQRRREDSTAPEKKSSDESEYHSRSGKKDRRRSDRYEGNRKHQDYRKEEDRYQKERLKEKQERTKDKKDSERNTDNETDVNLSDYLVCDSWSLDEKNNSSSPQVEETVKAASDKIPTPQPSTSTVAEKPTKPEPTDNLRQAMFRKNTPERIDTTSPMLKPNKKIQKLQPVIDSFKYEIDPNDDEILDMFDENSDLEKYSKVRKSYDSSQDSRSVDYDLDRCKEVSLDGMNDDNFLESVINEIKQEDDMTDDDASKGLVEYDFSPIKDEDNVEGAVGSVTPELDERMQRSFRSDYSDSLRSTDSDYKTSESGYKSVDSCLSIDSFRSEGKYELNMSNSTVSSLEMWSFVLKICQPLLFRHDRNKCYKETQTAPKLWYFENPKVCNCVKDRSVVYKELEICKLDHVNQIYESCKASEAPAGAGGAAARAWYPRAALCLTEAEAEAEAEAGPGAAGGAPWEAERRATPPADEISLDREYQRFMDAVWPEVVDVKQETARSTTPVRQKSRKKKLAEEAEEKKRSKKIKLSSEGWSQESDVEEEPEKNKKIKVEKEKEKKRRKRKHSTSTSTFSSLSESEPDSKRRKKAHGKANKKLKSKMAKRKKMDKKKLKKLREKQKKRKKMSKEVKMEEGSEDDFDENRKREHKKSKKKQQKLKRKNMKRKAKSSSSSESSSSSSSDSDSSDSDSDDRRTKKAKRKEEKARKKMEKQSRTQKKKRKSSSEELFDVNILNNIKKERVEDDNNRKKLLEQEFSPRRQQLKRIEIINVKELQDDFVGNNNIHIKQETVEDTERGEQKSAVEAKAVCEVKDVSEVKDVREMKDVSEERDVSEEKDVKEVNIVSEEKYLVKNLSEVDDVSEVKNLEEVKNMSEEKDVKEVTNVSGTGDAREVKDVKEAKDMIEVRNESEVKVVSEVKPLKEVKVLEEVQPVCEVKDQNNVYSFNLSDICMPQEKETNTKIEDVKESPRSAPQFDRATESQPSRESVPSLKDHPTYVKDDSRLRPPSPNSPYNFTDASQTDPYGKDAASSIECDDKFSEGYEPENYELYERLAMAYQNDVATAGGADVLGGGGGGGGDGGGGGGSRRIETVVRARPRGEIKCDWRAGEPPKGPPPDARADHRPSRWGLKPSEVNIVLTGGGAEAEPPQYPAGAPPEPEVFQIQSIANRNDSASNATGYDEAYMDMYGAADRLQYGDCFAEEAARPGAGPADPRWASLDLRIDHALRHSVLGEVAMEPESMDADKDGPERGISQAKAGRVTKRVSFADGYKPGQDSDAEEPPPIKPRRRSRRVGCAWPCPASHPDHVPLWDALPPPPPPPGSPPPPPPAPAPGPARRPPAPPAGGAPPVPLALKTDPSAPLPTILPPELPPGLITFT